MKQKIIISVSLLMLLLGSLILIKGIKIYNSEEGNITIILEDINEDVISEKEVSFNKKETVFDILNKNYILEYDESSYGVYLHSIYDEELEVGIDDSAPYTFISFYINSELSLLGIDAYYPKDGDIICLRVETWV